MTILSIGIANSKSYFLGMILLYPIYKLGSLFPGTTDGIYEVYMFFGCKCANIKTSHE